MKDLPPVLPILGFGALLAASIATLVWGSFRGLGLGDEGVYLLSARFPEDFLQNVSAVYFYTGALFALAGHDPVVFRLVGGVLLLLSAAVAWLGLRRATLLPGSPFQPAGTRPVTGTAGLLFVLVGAMAYYQWFFPTPNNYTLTAIGLNVFCGAMLFAMSEATTARPSTPGTLAASGIAGVSLGFLMFTKIPSGICLTLAALAMVALWAPFARVGRGPIFMSLVLGGMLWAALHFLLVLPPAATWQGFKDGWTLYQTFGVHVPGLKVVLYTREALLLIVSATAIFWPSHALLVAFLAHDLLTGPARHDASRLALRIGSVAALAVALSIVPGWSIPHRTASGTLLPVYLAFQLGWVILLCGMFAYASWRASRPAPGCASDKMGRLVLVIGFLMITPLGAAVGTANPLFNVTGFYMVPWYCAALVMLHRIAPTIGVAAPWFAFFCMSAIASFSTSQTIRGTLFNPQQIAPPLAAQRVPTHVGPTDDVLYLDRDSNALISALAALAHDNGFRHGDDIIASSYLPSLVYALGGRSPGHPAYLTGTDAEDAYSQMAIEFADLGRLRDAFVLTNTDESSVAALLAVRGLRFPQDYTRLGAIEHRGRSHVL